MTKKLITLALAAGLTLGLAACGGTTPTSTMATGSATSISTSTPTADTSTTAPSTTTDAAAPAAGTDAALAWEALMGTDGEYNSAAQYGAVIAKFGQVEPYVSIKAGEERHISALTRQLERFGVTVPPNPFEGKVTAPASLEAAAKAWAVGEVANVEMYDALLADVDDAGLKRVLTNLRRASDESHLPLFQAAADEGGTLAEEQMLEMGHGH